MKSTKKAATNKKEEKKNETKGNNYCDFLFTCSLLSVLLMLVSCEVVKDKVVVPNKLKKPQQKFTCRQKTKRILNINIACLALQLSFPPSSLG